MATARQRRWAARAAQLLTQSRPTWAVIAPVSPGSWSSIRARLDSLTGIWTIERGGVSGLLHANLLIADQSDPTEQTAHAMALVRSRARWAREIAEVDIPRIATYITKPDQTPDPGEWRGAVTGEFSPLRSARLIMLTATDAPVVQGLALDRHLGHLATQDRPLGSCPISPGALERGLGMLLACAPNIARLYQSANAEKLPTN